MNAVVTPEALENAAKEVDRHLASDRQFPELSEQISASQSRVFESLFNFLLILRHITA